MHHPPARGCGPASGSNSSANRLLLPASTWFVFLRSWPSSGISWRTISLTIFHTRVNRTFQFFAVISSTRVSLSIGFVAVGIAVVIGVILGAIAGYFGSWVDLVISRLFEVMLAIPTFFLLITVAAIFPPSIFLTMAIIGSTSWVGIARFTRNEFLRIRNLDYVTSAIALGVPDRTVMFKHILPNALAPVIVSVVLGIAGAILVESALSFLGIGVPAELVTWGSILHEASGATFAWWLAVFPGAAIFITVLSYYLVGEGLREVLDPRLRGLR